MSEVSVRISAATPEADLAAAVWPGVSAVTYSHVEAPEQIERADGLITRLERLRGLRPGTVALRPVIDSARGVAHAGDIAACSGRVASLEVGTSITLELGEDSLTYARGECALVARARGVMPLDPFAPHD